MSRLEEGVRAAAKRIEAQLDVGVSRKELAEAVLFYDALAVLGYREEMAELRASPDPLAAVDAILKTAEGG